MEYSPYGGIGKEHYTSSEGVWGQTEVGALRTEAAGGEVKRESQPAAPKGLKLSVENVRRDKKKNKKTAREATKPPGDKQSQRKREAAR